ncbi:MAG: flagellar filament capping protein FliD [Burkholderiaceae bacterium]|jgi:flagellar hook-associated protein 2|nr:flagellar filament capping protein FliD [Aquabacterium sp.]NUP85491.1 flagellar filament capping protein FliD [Burkholderiaceae bacterium]
MTTSISSVGSLSSAGLGSGLDVSAIISSLMAIESRPLDLLKQQATSLNTQISTYGKLQNYFSTMRDKANALTSSTLWDGTTASVSDTSAVKVTTSTGSTAGSYSVNVQSLAAAQTVVSNTFADSGTALGAGSLVIELGTWTGDPGDPFTPKSGAAAVTVDIVDGQSSLAEVRDAINAADAGVVASIVNDVNGARLSIRSKETGAENAFRITATETVDDGDPATGLSALSFDLGGGPSELTRKQTAANSLVQINGIDVESATNTLDNVVDGLSMTLLKPTATAVDVTVAADTETIKTKLNEFVTAYNELNNYLRTQTAYNASTKTGGALQGDQSAVSLQNQLRLVLNQASTASASWSQLSQVGITMAKDGTLSVNSTQLDAALVNLPELEKLFAGDGADTGSSGFIRRYKEMADAALSIDGTFTMRKDGLQSKLDRNGKSQDALEVRLAQVEARLRRQYTALDQSMASLNGLSNYVSQQMAMLAKTSSSDS